MCECRYLSPRFERQSRNVTLRSRDSQHGSPAMKSVVVTGASTGIGWGCVKVLIAGGFRVFGSVRRPADADRLSAEFGANFTPLTFDVTDEAAVARGAKQVEAALQGETLFGLVNNAGVSVSGPLLYLKVEDFRRQIEV